MLKTKNLTKVYKSKKGAEVRALKDVSVDFGDRGLVFLLGKSGSGKSTLMNLLGGIDKATSGEIVINGRSSSSFKECDYDSYRNTYVGFVFQDYNLIDNYTVGANIALALELQGKPIDSEIVNEMLKKVELVDEKGETLFNRQTNELSGGQKQRVAIARALIKSPQIILADEPTGALDSETGEQLYDLLKNLSKDKLVIVVTHDRENAEKYGDRVIELKDGKIVSDSAAENEAAKAANETAKLEVTAGNENSTTQPKLIQGKLPFKRCFSMGASGLKAKKFRLAISILLSVVAYVIFGFSATASIVDEQITEIKTMYANSQSIFRIAGYESRKGEALDYKMSERQLKMIREYNQGVDPISTAYVGRYDTDIRKLVASDSIKDLDQLFNYNPYFRVGLADSTYAAELDSTTGAADAKLRPDERFINKSLCKLPQTFSEIAITDIRADMFMRLGYKGEDGATITIKTPDDLIGRKFGQLTICGVYSTEQDRKYFEKFDINGYALDDNEYLHNRVYSATNSIISYNFVLKGFSENSDLPSDQVTSSVVLLSLSGDLHKDKEFLKKMSYEENGIKYSFNMESAFTYNVQPAVFFKNYVLTAAIIIAIIFSVFAALLMMNFLTVSIDFKKKELGILRALGASQTDVLKICIIESFIIASIDFVISLIAVIIICISCNAYFGIALFNISFLPILYLFLLCFGVAALATIIPVSRIVNKKPIDIINNK